MALIRLDAAELLMEATHSTFVDSTLKELAVAALDRLGITGILSMALIVRCANPNSEPTP
jgi:hypothetical protein